MEFIHKNTFHLPASQCSLSCKTPVCSKTLNMCMHFARIVMTTVKCGNVFWEVKKSILMMYWAVVSFVRCHPGIAQTLHGRLAQKLKDFCMYISNSCSMHFLRQWSFFFLYWFKFLFYLNFSRVKFMILPSAGIIFCV